MGADEEATLQRLKALRHELIDPRIAGHRGRIVKTTGDGMLVEFASVVDAVRCAVAVQRKMAERNVAVPADMRIEFRVGIHQGDNRRSRRHLWRRGQHRGAARELGGARRDLCVGARAGGRGR
jgi:adenylate cyclase